MKLTNKLRGSGVACGGDGIGTGEGVIGGADNFGTLKCACTFIAVIMSLLVTCEKLVLRVS